MTKWRAMIEADEGALVRMFMRKESLERFLQKFSVADKGIFVWALMRKESLAKLLKELSPCRT